MPSTAATSDSRSWTTKAFAVVLIPMAWMSLPSQHDTISLETIIDKKPSTHYTLEELRSYDGRPESGRDGTALLAVWGRVFNVSTGAEFYAAGMGYNLFAGHDCTRAFALHKTNKDLLDNSLDNLTESQLNGLNQSYWGIFVKKYNIVGVLIDPPYDPAVYNKYAGSFSEEKEKIGSAGLLKAAGAPTTGRKRESKCPVTRAARVVGDVVMSILPRLMLSGPADDGSEGEP